MHIAIVCLDTPVDGKIVREARDLAEKGHQVMVVYHGGMAGDFPKDGSILWRDVEAEMRAQGLREVLPLPLRVYDRAAALWNKGKARELFMYQLARLYAPTVRHFLDQFGPEVVLSCSQLSTRCVVWEVGSKAAVIRWQPGADALPISFFPEPGWMQAAVRRDHPPEGRSKAGCAVVEF